MVRLGQRNSRMKDFHDVWAISEACAFSGAELREAIRSCFERRGTAWTSDTPEALTPAFYSDTRRDTLWMHYRREKAFLAPPPEVFAIVGDRVLKFVAPVLESILTDAHFNLHWPAGGPWRVVSGLQTEVHDHSWNWRHGHGAYVTHPRENINHAFVSRLEPYPAYKDSGIEWLAQIPAHWGLKRLKFTADVEAGQSPPSDVVSAYSNGFPFLQGNAEFGDINPVPEFACEEAPKTAQVDDILLSVRAPVGAINIADQIYGIGRGLCAIHPKSDLESRFTYYLLLAIRDGLTSQATGSTYDAVTVGNVENLSTVLPPTPEQRAIAAFLDRKTAKIDALVAKKERLIELLQEKRTALITRAITKGLDPDVPMKDARVAWLEEIPTHWDVLRLFRLTPSDRSIMYGIVLPGPNVKDGVPIVKGGDVSSERLHLDMLNRTHPDIEAGHVRSRLRGGDLVYAIRGSIGDVAIIPNELDGANLTQDAARVAYTTATHGRWLLYTLKSAAIFSQLDAGALGATIRGINIRDLKRAVVPQPPQSEQRAIAAFLDRETAEIDALIAKGYEAIERLRELRTALISAAVTGKIDVRPDAGQFPENTS